MLNYTKAHCLKCKTSIDTSLMNAHIKEEKLLYCDNCKDIACKYIVVFYSEKLDTNFSKSLLELSNSDLVFIM